MIPILSPKEIKKVEKKYLIKISSKRKKNFKEKGKGFYVQKIRSYQYMARKSFVFFYISFNYIYIKEILCFKCKCY